MIYDGTEDVADKEYDCVRIRGDLPVDCRDIRPVSNADIVGG